MQNDPATPADQPHPESSEPRASGLHGDGHSRPAGVVVVAAVVALEALVLGVLGAWSIVLAATAPTHSLASGVFLIVLLLALSAGLALVAVNVYRGFRWTRSAAFVWQLLMVALAVSTLLEGNILLGLAMLLPPVAAAYFLFTPKVVAFSLRSGAENNVL
ncbi:hypothetical protein [Arthrobacter glacialis]|uniref:hypothetical protein n=1 Tax=Arthrobacter glacialis TaxID=1664 RepID=UPI0010571664|nr:hypothetical protein [Arthrobacter glacialis]